MQIEELRQRIDALDRQIVDSLAERARCAQAIGEVKKGKSLPAFDPAREQEVLRQILARNPGPLPAESLAAIYREIISGCRSLERDVSVAYWGPPASNTHVAARQQFGPEAAYLPTPTLAEVFTEVEKGRADYGVVPVENSTEGVVSLTLDMFLQTSLRICAETYVQIHHCLLSRERDLDAVRRLYTMPQATAQARAWLREHLPRVELVDVSTTARAAELAAAEPETAAIANRSAAEQYALHVLGDQIEDNPRNRTRFLILGGREPDPTGRDKTSLLFSVRHEAGALVRALAAFQEHGISLTFIQSRPTKLEPWEYVFFVDALGHARTPPLSEALPRLDEQCLFVRVLGSYPEV